MGAASDEQSVARSMSRIEDEAQRMGVLVEDLLTLARLDAVADAPHDEIDVGRLVRDAADDARAMAADREITTTGESAAIVRGDAHQLRQVLGNLIRNALVHTPAGTPIEIGLRRDNGTVTIEIRDHGPGLPSDDPQALFERFWRAEGGRERGHGAGLGLAIVAAIVDAHGGGVSAANAHGGGAVFAVTLPAV
jgi:two-component system OmpR family sensor kinase